eukprot:TRINITY_DN58555_c0_g1_i3.p1 TRINITY_DN58555_c0_g1~~TRINITY_DN58555_c0_g1_i3.p1  ORF type:complete len:546 (+),score=152.88 TRINITY_DN58555_c0_g1_i3:340-1977(+)
MQSSSSPLFTVEITLDVKKAMEDFDEKTRRLSERLSNLSTAAVLSDPLRGAMEMPRRRPTAASHRPAFAAGQRKDDERLWSQEPWGPQALCDGSAAAALSCAASGASSQVACSALVSKPCCEAATGHTHKGALEEAAADGAKRLRRGDNSVPPARRASAETDAFELTTKRSLSGLAEEMAATQRRLRDVEQNLKAGSSRLQRLQDAVVGQLPCSAPAGVSSPSWGGEEPMSALRQRLEEVERALERKESTLGHLRGRLGKLEGCLIGTASFEQIGQSVSEACRELENKLAQVERRVQEKAHKSCVLELRTSFFAVEEKAVRAAQALQDKVPLPHFAELKNRLGTVESQLQSLDRHLADIVGQRPLHELASAVASCETQVEVVKEHVKDKVATVQFHHLQRLLDSCSLRLQGVEQTLQTKAGLQDLGHWGEKMNGVEKSLWDLSRKQLEMTISMAKAQPSASDSQGQSEKKAETEDLQGLRERVGRVQALAEKLERHLVANIDHTKEVESGLRDLACQFGVLRQTVQGGVADVSGKRLRAIKVDID